VSDPSVAEAGEVADAPGDGELYTSEVDTGYGEIGSFIQWMNLKDGWILAKDTDSFVSLDNNL